MLHKVLWLSLLLSFSAVSATARGANSECRQGREDDPFAPDVRLQVGLYKGQCAQFKRWRPVKKLSPEELSRVGIKSDPSRDYLSNFFYKAPNESRDSFKVISISKQPKIAQTFMVAERLSSDDGWHFQLAFNFDPSDPVRLYDQSTGSTGAYSEMTNGIVFSSDFAGPSNAGDGVAEMIDKEQVVGITYYSVNHLSSRAQKRLLLKRCANRFPLSLDSSDAQKVLAKIYVLAEKYNVTQPFRLDETNCGIEMLRWLEAAKPGVLKKEFFCIPKANAIDSVLDTLLENKVIKSRKPESIYTLPEFAPYKIKK